VTILPFPILILFGSLLPLPLSLAEELEAL
jgi:hypothetical protein